MLNFLFGLLAAAIIWTNGAGGDTTGLQQTTSTNEAPGIWAEQPGTVPVCSSRDDADVLMAAYIEELRGIPWSAESARLKLSAAMSMETTTCHLELLPSGMSEHVFFDDSRFIDIQMLFPRDEKGMPYIERGIATLVISESNFILLTENEAVIRAYGTIQSEAGKMEGYLQGYADGVNMHQAPPPGAVTPEPTGPQVRNL